MSCAGHVDPGGELVHGDGRPALLAAPLQISADTAVRQALARYLGAVTFSIWEGVPDVSELSRAREFRLVRVLPDFPGPTTELVYPSASISETVAQAYEGGMTPGVLEDSYAPETGSVLWQLGRVDGLLQVDFWADSPALRDAIAAALPGVMNPNEGMSGFYLRLPSTYASAVARYLQLTQETVDQPESAWANERRLMLTVRYTAPVLVRRAAVPLRAMVRTDVSEGPV